MARAELLTLGAFLEFFAKLNFCIFPNRICRKVYGIKRKNEWCTECLGKLILQFKISPPDDNSLEANILFSNPDDSQTKGVNRVRNVDKFMFRTIKILYPQHYENGINLREKTYPKIAASLMS